MARTPPLRKGEALEVGRAWQWLLETVPYAKSFNIGRNGIHGYSVYIHGSGSYCAMGLDKTPMEAAQAAAGKFHP